MKSPAGRDANMADNERRNKQILIAEDNPVSRRMLETFLTQWGYQVVSAADGLEALRLLEREDAPPLAVLDWMMPGIEGPQVCKRVRERSDRPYTYILLLTARTQKEDLLRGLESGADDYLTKPFDAHELHARLRVGQRILDLQDRLLAADKELRFRATHDLLTGIANRGVALDAIRREHARRAREGGSFAVIIADIDHFKRVNDTLGHLAGDAVLKEVARRMVACVRPYDTVGRYGGEEFLIVAPSVDAAGALALAERVRNGIQATPILMDADAVTITASCGVAVSGPSQPFDPESLLRLADEALYRAKDLGRNRSETAPVPQSVTVSSAHLLAPAKSQLR
jgi:two-component system, cell cycle response regulator